VDQKALLDLTLEVAKLEQAERLHHHQWQQAKQQKQAKFEELLALTRSEHAPAKSVDGPPERTKDAPKLSAKRKVLELLNANPGRSYTTGAIASAVHAPRGSVSMYLGELTRAGLVTRLDVGEYQAKLEVSQ
jgi:DNA-binding transcriptional ArsR family regulator